MLFVLAFIIYFFLSFSGIRNKLEKGKEREWRSKSAWKIPEEEEIAQETNPAKPHLYSKDTTQKRKESETFREAPEKDQSAEDRFLTMTEIEEGPKKSTVQEECPRAILIKMDPSEIASANAAVHHTNDVLPPIHEAKEMEKFSPHVVIVPAEKKRQEERTSKVNRE